MLNSLIIMDLNFVNEVYDEDSQARISELTYLKCGPISRDKLLNDPNILADVDIIFSGWQAPYFDEMLLECAPNLKIVFYAAGSINKVVSDAFWKRGVLICAANSVNAIPVAEYTLAATIMGLKHSASHHHQVRTNKQYQPANEMVIIGGYRAKIGLLSLGAIAQTLIKYYQMFDYEVVVYDPYASDALAASLNVTLVSMEDIFTSCDVVSVHTPLLDATRHMINKEHFLMMKENATFINTARGAIIKEDEMIEALKIRSDIEAYIDVTDPEPPLKDSPLFKMNNVFLTPHIAGSLGNELARMGALMVSELEHYLKDEPLEHHISEAMFEVMA